jgi:hypothetical protein
MRLLICSATQKKTKQDTKLYPSLKKILQYNPKDYITYFFATENAEKLPKIYNQFLDKAKSDQYDWLVICHDDIDIDTIDLPCRLEALDKKYNFSVIGVAGCSQVKMKQPALWHFIGVPHLHGDVAHTYNNTQKITTSFGPYPNRAVLIDGVVIAIKLLNNNVRVDESNPSKWHFYDLDFSMSCYQSRIKVGVGDIMITHDSPGLRNRTEEWQQGEQWFLNKWKNINDNNQ